MKKQIAAAIALLGVFALAGCTSAEGQYVQEVRETVSASQDKSDEEIVAFGRELCASAEEHGAAALIFALGFASVGMEDQDSEDMSNLTAATFKHLCPEYVEDLKDFTENMDNGDIDNTAPDYNPEG